MGLAFFLVNIHRNLTIYIVWKKKALERNMIILINNVSLLGNDMNCKGSTKCTEQAKCLNQKVVASSS